MKAVRLHEYGGPEKLTFDTDVPPPMVNADSVLVEAAATSVNPIDWKIRSGARQADFPLKLPAILGKDVSGVVREVGANVRTFKPGDRVLAMPERAAALHPAVTVTRVFARPDASKVREFADDVRDGRFVLPVSRRMPLRQASEAHALLERGGGGKTVLAIR